jgi:hypothetical protein
MFADDGDSCMGDFEAVASSSKNNERDCFPMPNTQMIN